MPTQLSPEAKPDPSRSEREEREHERPAGNGERDPGRAPRTDALHSHEEPHGGKHLERRSNAEQRPDRPVAATDQRHERDHADRRMHGRSARVLDWALSLHRV